MQTDEKASLDFVPCHLCGTHISPLHATWRIVTDWQTMHKVEVAECEGCWEERR